MTLSRNTQYLPEKFSYVQGFQLYNILYFHIFHNRYKHSLSSITENVQKVEGDLRRQGQYRRPHLRAGRQAYQKTGLRPGQVRVRDEGKIKKYHPSPDLPARPRLTLTELVDTKQTLDNKHILAVEN